MSEVIGPTYTHLTSAGSDLMDIKEILQHLKYNEGLFPQSALEEAIARREQIIPELLLVLEHAERDAQGLLERDGYMAHIYSMYLLAQFREVRAYPLLVRFFSLPGEISVDLTGDVVTEDLGRLLASVSCGDATLMEGLIENEQANEWVRGAAVVGMVTLVSSGERSREEVIDYFGDLFRGRLVRQPGQVGDSLVACSTVLCPDEVRTDIEKAYDEGLVDPFYISWAEVGDALKLGKQQMLSRLRRDPHRRLVTDTIAEMKWWACFDQEYGAKADHDPAPLARAAASSLLERQQPIRRTGPKVGRNEPCPCGSGKKYKKCCGAH